MFRWQATIRLIGPFMISRCDSQKPGQTPSWHRNSGEGSNKCSVLPRASSQKRSYFWCGTSTDLRLAMQSIRKTWLGLCRFLAMFPGPKHHRNRTCTGHTLIVLRVKFFYTTTCSRSAAKSRLTQECDRALARNCPYASCDRRQSQMRRSYGCWNQMT